jgi:nucleotidyltransferase substrate binding protein (TIGR01987 family)
MVIKTIAPMIARLTLNKLPYHFIFLKIFCFKYGNLMFKTIILRQIPSLNNISKFKWGLVSRSKMKDQDIRWKQRFQNFEKALNQLMVAVGKKDLSDLEKAGCIQFYEFTFELAWKTLNDYLTFQSVSVKFPRDTIKEAFKYGLIDDGDIWMDMLEKRNLMSHTYDETNADIAYHLISENYYKAILSVFQKLKSLQ